MLNIDTSHPLYRPLWVRLLIVGFCAAWAVIEFVNREFFWGTIVGGIAAYAAYELLVKFKPASVDDAAKGGADKAAPDEPADKAPVDKNDAG
ncbi:hypothetical protein [Rhizobium rhizogenes]|uniref:hypothetical protein n=1 Tax=Rhizobium rhizogenes TaxID=359 RepID=UPI0022CB2FF4|nr:hypothetical protein [Rhizobium rhizogenes]MCZ7466629.1 hypothetical protein [Rhizobium rhizogenes]